jgi:poly(A) polymerase
MNVTQKPHLHQDWIDPHAIGIVRALQKNNFATYLVGGCVRDLLLGIHPKDFDIATNAKPDEVRRIIHRSYIIGKRFRLVLVRREGVQFEVATFRREVPPREVLPEEPGVEGTSEAPEEEIEVAPIGDNVFGSEEEDARRRDFTINGLFYDPIRDQMIDYAEGLPDLEKGWVRMIGDPDKRLLEDPIRILRALRLKHMIGFALDPDLRRAMSTHAHSIPTTVLPRRREEILKLLRLKAPELAFREAYDLGVLKYLSPTLHELIDNSHGDEFFTILTQASARRADEATPLDLFADLVHAFARTSLQAEPGSGSRAREIFSNEKFQAWMRDELGVFKYEQALILKALSVEPLLARRKDFQRRGERRQRALLANEAFPLALRYAEIDYSLSGDDLMYWNEKSANLKPQQVGGGNPRPRRRRPRRNRKPGGRAEARS